MLAPSAREFIEPLIPLSNDNTDNLFHLQVDQWLELRKAKRVVSAEIVFGTPSERFFLQVRFRPGPETRPMAAAYACDEGIQ